VQYGEDFAKVKMDINKNQQILEERKNFHTKQKLENKNLEVSIAGNERRIVEERGQNKRIQDSILNL